MKMIFAVFAQDQGGGYSVSFPDIESCYSQGDDVHDAYEMAADALCLKLYDMEEAKESIPRASNPKDISVDLNSFVALVAAGTPQYRMYYDNKAIKKTITNPLESAFVF